MTWPKMAVVRAWTVAAVVGFAFLVAHLAFNLGGSGLDNFAERWVYDGLELIAAAGCLMRAATNRNERWIWAILGLGILSFSLGDICFDFVYGGNPSSPSICDAFYLAFYPACYAALALLIRSRISHFDRSVWLDGAIAAFAATAVSASIVLQVVLNNTTGSAETVIVNLAYPAADLVLLAIVIFVFVLTGRRPGRAWAAAGIAFGAIAVARQPLHVPERIGRVPGGHAAGRTLAGCDAPARRCRLAAGGTPRRPARGPIHGDSAHLRPCVALAVLADEHFKDHNIVADILAVAAIVTVFIRTGISLVDNARLLASVRAQSLTDDLTGLGNRRGLLLALEHQLSHRSGKTVFAIYDLNGFKRYNDTFGHPSGDALLVRLAARLAEAAGPSGEAFRLGGDEFCLLVRADGRETAAVVEAGLLALSEAGRGVRDRCGVRLDPPAGRSRGCHNGAPVRRRTPLRAEVQPWRQRRRVSRGPAARDRGARARAAPAHALRGRVGVRGRRPSGPGGPGTGAVAPGGRASRRRQACDPDRRPAEAAAS